MAKNEAMYRTVNRELEYAAEQLGDAPTVETASPLDITRRGRPTLTLTIADYDDVHRQRDRFAVAPGHEDPTLERVVKETEAFVVVDKFGAAEAIAESEEEREGTS